MGLFRKKKEKPVQHEPEKQEPVSLEKLCGDNELYKDMSFLVPSDPKRFKTIYKDAQTVKDALALATKYEKEGNLIKAKTYYERTARLSFYENDSKSLETSIIAFGRICGEEKYPKVLEDPKKAVEVAQKYYRKLKEAAIEAEKKAREEKEIIKSESTNKK